MVVTVVIGLLQILHTDSKGILLRDLEQINLDTETSGSRQTHKTRRRALSNFHRTDVSANVSLSFTIV